MVSHLVNELTIYSKYAFPTLSTMLIYEGVGKLDIHMLANFYGAKKAFVTVLLAQKLEQ